MTSRWRSPNHGPRQLPLDMVVLHYTGMRSAQDALQRLCDPDADVSAHFLIDEVGALHSLVDPKRRAWHAGVSSWEGVSDVNSRSIGIELVNPGHEWGYRPFPKPQIDTLIGLLGPLTRQYRISPTAIWGHSDIAPQRKRDPGEKFPWARLARYGFGLWPKFRCARRVARDSQVLLHIIGYDVVGAQALNASQDAFKQHFRPMTVGQKWTAADTCLAQNLAATKQRLFFRRWA